jgi:hypothetical protein
LDSIFHGSSRIPSSGQSFVPGQQECNSFGKEWKGFEQQAYKAHQSLFSTSLLLITLTRAMYPWSGV